MNKKQKNALRAGLMTFIAVPTFASVVYFTYTSKVNKEEPRQVQEAKPEKIWVDQAFDNLEDLKPSGFVALEKLVTSQNYLESSKLNVVTINSLYYDLVHAGFLLGISVPRAYEGSLPLYFFKGDSGVLGFSFEGMPVYVETTTPITEEMLVDYFGKSLEEMGLRKVDGLNGVSKWLHSNFETGRYKELPAGDNNFGKVDIENTARKYGMLPSGLHSVYLIGSGWGTHWFHLDSWVRQLLDSDFELKEDLMRATSYDDFMDLLSLYMYDLDRNPSYIALTREIADLSYDEAVWGQMKPVYKVEDILARADGLVHEITPLYYLPIGETQHFVTYDPTYAYLGYQNDWNSFKPAKDGEKVHYAEFTPLTKGQNPLGFDVEVAQQDVDYWDVDLGSTMVSTNGNLVRIGNVLFSNSGRLVGVYGDKKNKTIFNGKGISLKAGNEVLTVGAMTTGIENVLWSAEMSEVQKAPDILVGVTFIGQFKNDLTNLTYYVDENYNIYNDLGVPKGGLGTPTDDDYMILDLGGTSVWVET